MFFGKKRKIHEAEAVAGRGVPQHTGVQTAIVGDRRYYRSAPYALPKDLLDINRLDLQHYMLRQAIKGNYLAPLDQEQTRNMLDVGCGTGRWCIEMAQAFPKAQIIGVDLERGENIGVERPINYQFVQEDILKRGLPFANNSFDYVHQRLLIMGVPEISWVSEMQEIMRVLRPGGMVELLESGTTFVPAGPYTQQWCALGRQISKPRGINPDAAPLLIQYARKAGLVEIEEHTFDLPVGDWNGKATGQEGRIGRMLQTNLISLYNGCIPPLQQAGVDDRTIQTMPRLLLQEWAAMQAQLRYFVVIGKKPVSGRT